MTIRNTTPHRLVVAIAAVSALLATGCSKKEPAPQAAATPPPAATPTPKAAAPTPSAPAKPAADPLKSMVATATQAAETSAAQVKEAAATTPAPTAPTPAPASPPAAPAAPAALASGLAAAQESTQSTGESTAASLAATAGALQKQAEELLSQYSGELATLKSGALAVKSYVDKHPELLPEAAKAKYQQLNAMVPQLESLVGTLKDYKSVDLTTLVPKLQTDFAKAKSLYSEVRGLLPASL